MSTRSKSGLCINWKLYAITCPERLAGRDPVRVVEEVIEGGADVVQLRDKTASDEALTMLARKLLVVTRRANVPLVINDRLRVAKDSAADGFHMGQEDGTLSDAISELGPDRLYGRSTHSPEQVLAAAREGFDYIGVGPVYETPTKAGRAAVGLELVRYAADHSSLPFVAIGGVDETNVRHVREAGARCVAVVRALCGSGDPLLAAKRFKKVMGEVV